MAGIKIVVSEYVFLKNLLPMLRKKCQSLVSIGENSNISVISMQFLA